MRLPVASALAILLTACGGGQSDSVESATGPGLGTASHEIRPSLKVGLTYDVRTETSSQIESATAGKTRADVVVESKRDISAGGVFRQDALKWKETVGRIQITGDKSWDSNGTEPPADDLVEVAALSGATYVVDVDPRGIAAVSSLDVPMTKLSDSQREKVRSKMGNVERVASGLAGSVAAAMSSTPSGPKKVGEVWKHERRNPALGPDATVQLEWTLAKVENGEARFDIKGTYKTKAVASGSVKGHATYRLDEQIFTAIEETTEIVLHDGAGRLITVNRVRVSVRVY